MRTASALTAPFTRAKAAGRAALVGYLPAGYPSVDGAASALREMVAGRRVRLNGEVVKSLKQAVGEGDKFEVTDAAGAPTKDESVGGRDGGGCEMLVSPEVGTVKP